MHTLLSLGFVRVALVFFFYERRGFYVRNHQQWAEIIKLSKAFQGGMLIIHYVASCHFVGGFLLVIRPATRLGGFLQQLPILMGGRYWPIFLGR